MAVNVTKQRDRWVSVCVLHSVAREGSDQEINSEPNGLAKHKQKIQGQRDILKDITETQSVPYGKSM